MTPRVQLQPAVQPAAVHCLRVSHAFPACLALTFTALTACGSSAAHAQGTMPVALREVVVTATRFEEPAGDRPVNVSVISRDAIAASAARTLPELLANQPGIAVRDLYGGSGSFATVDMRGFGAVGGQNTLVLVDGRPVNEIDLSFISWSMLPLSSIERVEIVRGGGAVQYGAGASGGVINVITRLPAAGERSAEMKLQAGSLGTREASIAGAFGTGPLALRLYASHFESDGYRANNRDEQEVGQGDLRWRDGANTVTARFALDRQSTRLPGARTVQPSVGLDEVATAPRGTSTPLDYATRDGARASVDFDRVLDVGELNIGLGWRNKKQVSFFELGGFPDYREIDLTVLGLTPRLRIAHTVAGASASTTVGVDVYRWDYRRLVSDAQANIGQPVNTVKAAQNTSALYVATNIAFATGTTVSGGVRGERYRISANDTYDATAPGAAFGSGAPAGDQSLNQHAWDVGVRQALSRGWALIGKAGRSYRFANVDEIYGFSPLGTRQFAFLRPQTAVGGEVAVDYDTPGAAARLSMFRLDVDDELRFDPYTFINTNLAPLRREGVELGGRVQAARTLGLTAAYTYTRARFRGGVAPGTPGFTLTDVALAGRTVPLVPAHLLALGATWAPVAEVKLSASARHVGSAVMDNDENNTLATRIPAHTLVDLRAVWDVAGWQFGFNVNNLFNRSYFNYAVRSTSTFTPDRYNAYPLPGRTMLVTASYRFR